MSFRFRPDYREKTIITGSWHRKVSGNGRRLPSREELLFRAFRHRTIPSGNTQAVPDSAADREWEEYRSVPAFHKPAGGLFENYDANTRGFLPGGKRCRQADREIGENDRQNADHQP